MKAVKHSLKRNFPLLYQCLYSAKQYVVRQSRTEYRVIRSVVRTLLRRDLWRPAPWREVLPIQVPQHIAIRGMPFNTMQDLLADLDSRELAHSCGTHLVYFPPATLRATPFGVLRHNYPPNVGLKIDTEPRRAVESSLSASGRMVVKRGCVRSGQLSLVANLLYQSNLGPRLYDVVKLECGDTEWTAFVVEHIDGARPSATECQRGVNRIRELERSNVVKTTLPGAYDHADSQCPVCDGNALIDRSGRFRYLGFQNLALVNYARYLHTIAVRAAKHTHFGEKSMLRGGEFLYQSIPGIRLGAKRNTEDRATVLGQLMEAVGLAVGGRLVLDIGCNAGMMMAEYLKWGAQWCHGWDTPRIRPRTEAVLLALGCTRFSTTGAFIERTRNLAEDVPAFARRMFPGCVISYLAVRRHLGWLDALGHLPWSFLIYEGHQYETQEDFWRHMDQLRGLADFEVVNVGSYKDGFSDERVVAILVNTSAGNRP